MEITGTMYVYKSQQYGGYSTYVKNIDKEKMYISVGFKKGQEPTEDNLKLEVKHAFLSFYKTKEGLCKPKIVVTEYSKEQDQNYTSISEDEFADLPF